MEESKLKSASILLVDDDVSNTSLLANFLGRLGYTRVETINDPSLIFDTLTRFRPDLILLDLMMPGFNGFQILESLRRRSPDYERPPVIVITGDATPENKRRALGVGATDLLAKPVDPSEANMRIRNVLTSHFLQRETAEHNRLLEERVQERTAQLQLVLDDLQAAQRQMLQQERLEAFSQMAGGVVHDFSNALMSIIGYSEMLVEADGQLLFADIKLALDYLRTINTAGRDAAEIVSRLRDYYRPRETAEHFEPLDAHELVRQVIQLTKPRSRERRIRVEAKLEPVPTFSGNGSELRETLINLVLNAVDASPPDSLVTLRAAAAGDGLCFEVIDSGCGMSAEVQARCLDPFFTTKGEAGTGLGLPMVFGIVKRHGGELAIESAPGSGTTFRVSLPATGPVVAAPETLAA